MGVARYYNADHLREKQQRAYEAHMFREEEREMANDQTELDLTDEAEVAGESKAERFSRVVNPRIKVAVKRLRLIRQMFEGANANNYEFTVEQHLKLTKALANEVEAISELMLKRIHGRKDDEVETI